MIKLIDLPFFQTARQLKLDFSTEMDPSKTEWIGRIGEVPGKSGAFRVGNSPTDEGSAPALCLLYIVLFSYF